MTVTFATPHGSYAYDVYPMNTRWNAVGGIYIFAFQGTDLKWYALYVGQTNNFSARLSNHEKLAQAINLGATHILARTNDDQRARDTEEANMIAFCQPRLNEMLR